MGALKNAKQELFCQEYLMDLNATQAYIRAGYSARSADSCAARLIGNARIRARIDELLARRSARTGINQDRVVRELARIAFLDPARLANLNSAIVISGATEDDRADIAFIRIALGTNRTHSGNGKPYSYIMACVHGAGGNPSVAGRSAFGLVGARDMMKRYRME